MDLDDIPPIDKAVAILGEHYRNYVVIFQEEDHPMTYDMAYSDAYNAKGLLHAAKEYHNNFLECVTEFEEDEWDWSDCEEECEDDDD